MWNVIKVVFFCAVVIFQLVIVTGAESAAEETGNYDKAIFEMLWLMLLVFIAESTFKIKEDK